ncbi:MAG: ribosome maturation factor RimM [Actinomycetota bacterium]
MVGEILRPHGVRGEVAIKTHTENPERFAVGARLLVGTDPGEAAAMEVASSRGGRRPIVRFAGVEDRNAAEGLRGRLVFVAAAEMPAPGQDAYWPHQLAGLTVADAAGRPLGTLTGVVPGSEHDLWEVDTGHGVVRVPAVREIVRSVDLEAGVVTVEPPVGLFEDTS